MPRDTLIRLTYLLQLLILQVASNHHLQYNKQLAVADVAIAVNVVDLECKPQLLLFVSFRAERGQTRHKLLKVDITTTVFVENSDHSCGEGIRGDLW